MATNATGTARAWEEVPAVVTGIVGPARVELVPDDAARFIELVANDNDSAGGSVLSLSCPVPPLAAVED